MACIFSFLNINKKFLKKGLFTFIICISFLSLFAQKKQPHNNRSSVHLWHVILPHETFNSIGKLYGISGQEVADYNNLEYYKDEVLAKYLTIPLNKYNYTEEKKYFSNEILVPVFQFSGTAERIVEFKKNNNKTRAHESVIFNNNKLITNLKGKRYVDGFLHTSKAYEHLFKTVVQLPEEEVAVVKKDTVKTSPTVKEVTTTPVLAANTDSISVAKNNLTPSKKTNAFVTHSRPTVPAMIEVDTTSLRPVSREDKILFLVKIQIIITGFLVMLIFLYMAVKNRQEVFNQRLKGSLRALLIDEIFAEPSFTEGINRGFTVSEYLKKQLDNKANRQFVIDEIINGKKNIKGKVGDNFLKLYLELNLEQDSCNKLKSKNWNKVAKGIQELAMMERNHKMPEIFKEINNPNEYVRMEAQSALVHLSGFGGLWFLNVLNYSLSEWQQMRLISMLSNSPVSDIPDLRPLLTSANDSLVIFTIKLIGVLQQRILHNEVVKCLANKSEAIRYVAIKCLKEIHNQHTPNVLSRKFTNEARKNKIAIINVIGELESKEQVDFLLEVLSMKDDSLKIAAARALSKLGVNGNGSLEEYCNTHGSPYSQIFLHIKSAV